MRRATAELAEIAALGIKYVRLPITWCFNWRDMPLTIYGTSGNVTLPPHLGEVLVADPFHGSKCGEAGDRPCQWLAIPESRVTDVLARAAALGLEVSTPPPRIRTLPDGAPAAAFSFPASVLLSVA